MNGESMYRLWAQINDDQGCMVDEWGALDEQEQRAWNTLAEVVAV